MKRCEALIRFLDTTRDAVSALGDAGSPAARAAARIFSALEASTGDWAPDPPEPPPAHRHLAAALDNAQTACTPILTLAESFAVLAPAMHWHRRTGAEDHGEMFYHGHANAAIIGPTGLERRRDVLVGASLVAPEVRYVDHNHPPEEIYVVMSEGEWYRKGRGWYTPGVGGIVYHPPSVVHAMRAGPEPLLAVWLLWVGQ